MTVSDTMTSLGAALASQYALERELGRGGMATVYLARDLRHDRLVALKVLRPELGPTLGSGRFQREIHLAARLSHPNILPLFDSGDADGHLWYAMPFVEGESLRQRLKREGQLGVAEAVRITRQVALGLAYAHGQGIVHRDIKPENILLAGDQVLVADFGIAKALDASSGEKLTETGLSLGTPAYMSPEQAAGGGVDARSDVYALGCVLYEMLAGTPPFTGPTAQAIMARHSVDPVPPLRTVRATIPWAIEQAVVQALAKVPADRFATAAEFAEALVAESAPAPRFHWPVSARTMRAGLGIIVGVSVVAVAARMMKERSIPAVLPSAESIAVLPLVATAADTSLVRLGQDLGVTITASLDGIGGIQTADRLSIASATAGRPDLSPFAGAALARKLGARSILRGMLVRAGDNVRLDLGLYSTEGLAPLAEGITVSNHRDSVGALTDSAVWALLRHVWQRGKPPSPSLDAVTTRSLPALRAFLQGERELGANRWTAAALAFSSAIAADSTFWLAHFRHALAEGWLLERVDVDPKVVRALRVGLDSLPQRERLLMAAWLDTMPLGERIERYRTITQRFPHYWLGWLLFSDLLFHQGPLLGHDWTETLEAFRRVVVLNPSLIPAWQHISELTYDRDPGQDSIAMARLTELDWPGMLDPTIRLDIGVGKAGGVIPPTLVGLADSVVTAALSPNPAPLDCRICYHLLRAGYPVAQLQLNARAVRVAEPRPTIGPSLRASSAWAWAARGRWDSALTILSEAAKEHPGVVGESRYDRPFFVPVGGPVLAIESYGLAVLGVWLGTTTPAVAGAGRPAAVAAIVSLGDEESRRDAWGRLAWLDGLLGFARKDRRAIDAARKEVNRSGFFQAEQVNRSLAAFDRALAGDRERAGRELAGLEEACANDDNHCNFFTPSIAVQRLAAAQWLAETGDSERARRLLRYLDAAVWPSWLYSFNDVLAAPTYLARARLEEDGGDARRAGAYYRQFLRRYDQPMPAQAALVREANEALARLGEGS
jgi:serine/threonine-protein kinase